MHKQLKGEGEQRDFPFSFLSVFSFFGGLCSVFMLSAGPMILLVPAGDMIMSPGVASAAIFLLLFAMEEKEKMHLESRLRDFRFDDRYPVFFFTVPMPRLLSKSKKGT